MIRVAVIGLGGMGTAHTADLVGFEGCMVTLGVDCSSAAAETYTEKFGVPASVWINPDAFDAAIVTTPHYQHYSAVMACLLADKHVLVEKPLAMSLAEGTRMVAEAKPRFVFATCQHRRADGMWRALKRRVNECRGELTNIRIDCRHNQRALYESYGSVGDARQWRSDPEKSGGGILIDTGNHINDLLFWILGEEPTVTAAAIERNGTLVESTVEVAAVFPTGARLDALYTIDHAGGHHEEMVFSGVYGEIARYDSGKFFGVEGPDDYGLSPARNFAMAIAGREQTQAPAWEALRVLNYTDQVYAHGR